MTNALGVHVLNTLQDRVDAIAERAIRWSSLRIKPRVDKKLAITVFSFPPDKGNVGTAAYLDVFGSIHRVMEEMQANIQAENERMKAEMDEMQADLQRQRNEVAQHREIVKETIGGMTELADATKKEIDDLTDKMQAELAEVKFCHELSR